MDFIGGGASNYLDMFNYMGEKREPLGSPFDISFPDVGKGYDTVYVRLPLHNLIASG
jgi:hypothetical protein